MSHGEHIVQSSFRDKVLLFMCWEFDFIDVGNALDGISFIWLAKHLHVE